MRRAFEIYCAHLGGLHPSTRTIMRNHARLLREMGRGEPKIQAQLKAVGAPYGVSFDEVHAS